MFAATFALVLATVPAAEPEKPVTPREDELAVLADPKSPDHKTVLERYDGKVLKLAGRVIYSGGDRGGESYYQLQVPGKTKADPVIKLYLKWSDDPEAKRARDRVRESRTGQTLTIYGRAAFHVTEAGRQVWHNDGLKDAATDPKAGGVPYVPKEKPPARLKDK